jgi:hypothetical protein
MNHFVVEHHVAGDLHDLICIVIAGGKHAAGDAAQPVDFAVAVVVRVGIDDSEEMRQPRSKTPSTMGKTCSCTGTACHTSLKASRL